MNKLEELKSTLSSSISATYRFKYCHLGHGEKIVNIGQKEWAAATQHFKNIELQLIEKVILEELTYGEYAKQIFKTQQLILSTFRENIVVTEYIEDFIKITYGIYGNKQNVNCLVKVKSYGIILG